MRTRDPPGTVLRPLALVVSHVPPVPSLFPVLLVSLERRLRWFRPALMVFSAGAGVGVDNRRRNPPPTKEPPPLAPSVNYLQQARRPPSKLKCGPLHPAAVRRAQSGPPPCPGPASRHTGSEQVSSHAPSQPIQALARSHAPGAQARVRSTLGRPPSKTPWGSPAHGQAGNSVQASLSRSSPGRAGQWSA